MKLYLRMVKVSVLLDRMEVGAGPVRHIRQGVTHSVIVTAPHEHLDGGRLAAGT